MSKTRLSKSSWLALLVAVCIGALAYFSPITNTSSDPQFTLLVSQTMLRHQTVKMDINREILGPVKDRAFVELANGHLYYYFPMGTPILSMPFVGIANLLGLDMADQSQEAATQNMFSAVLVALSFLVVYRICTYYLSPKYALILAVLTFLGSALTSTLSTALWSIDFAVLFVGLSLLILTKLSVGERRPSYPYLLGIFLFGSYLCRPSTFLFVGLTLAYLLMVDRKSFWRTAVLAFLLLLGFLVFIRMGYGSWLPPYYNDFGRLTVERRPLYESFFGNLVSPSRGILLYSPFLLLTLVGAIFYFRKLKDKPLFWLITTWFGLHLVLVARTTRWWGGLSFGPRILAETLPGLILLTAMVGGLFMAGNGRKNLRIVTMTSFGILSVWAIFLNSYQGLFNYYTAWWHGVLTPNIDYEPEYLWDLDNIQFLADNDQICRRDWLYIEEISENPEVVRNLYPYKPGQTLEIVPTPRDPFLLYKYVAIGEMEEAVETAETADLNPINSQVFFPAIVHDGEEHLPFLLSGLAPPQAGYRWSMCESAAVVFLLDRGVDANQPYELTLLSGSFGQQRVEISLNGTDLGQIEFNERAAPPVVKTISIPAGVLLPGEVNQIMLNLPDAVIPDLPREGRKVGLSLVSVRLDLAAP